MTADAKLSVMVRRKIHRQRHHRAPLQGLLCKCLDAELHQDDDILYVEVREKAAKLIATCRLPPSGPETPATVTTLPCSRARTCKTEARSQLTSLNTGMKMNSEGESSVSTKRPSIPERESSSTHDHCSRGITCTQRVQSIKDCQILTSTVNKNLNQKRETTWISSPPPVSPQKGIR